MKLARKFSLILLAVSIFESMGLASPATGSLPGRIQPGIQPEVAAVQMGSAVETLGLTVSPAVSTIGLNGQLQMSAVVTGSSTTAVTWKVSGTGCSASACGTITSSGVYRAPAVVPKPAQVTVTATTLAVPVKTASAVINIVPEQSVSVGVTPSAVTLSLGQKQQFTATVTGSTNTAVQWSVSGAGCSGGNCGTITTAGLYTAPAGTPKPAQVTVMATSVAAPSQSATATVTIASVTVLVSPSTAQVLWGTAKQFTATVSGSVNMSVRWSVAGTGCSGAACGTISATGLYTAPSATPKPAQVTITATSLEETSKSGSATVTITSPIQVSVAPTAVQVHAGNSQQFTSTVTGTTNTAVSWSLHGSGCSGATCGTISSSGLYTAPALVPSPALVTVTATSVADTTKSGAASVTVIPPIVVAVAPQSVQVAVGASQKFVSVVTGTTNTAVTWTVTGTGCSGTSCGTILSNGVYTAPSVAPNPALVMVTATSVADTTKNAKSSVTIVQPISIALSPTSAGVQVGATQQFKATLTNTTNTAVTWTVAGGGCSGAACGTISATGLYTAPAAVPTPPQVTVTATSVADTTKSASATVTIQSLITITPSNPTLAPGAMVQFVASGPGSGVVIWSATGQGCTGITCGYINATGGYTAPTTAPSPAIVTVTATSLSNPALSGSTQVTIVTSGKVAVTVTPSSAVVSVGGQQQFSAGVTGTTNTAVVWSVSGYTCAGSACGTVSSSGLYTAPATAPNPAIVNVTATSVADSTKSSTAMVTITQSVGVVISPMSAQVTVGGSRQFTASVTGNSNQTVTWNVTGSGCTGVLCGTISSTGLYTAPLLVPSPPQVEITATSNADGQTSASAIVTIVSAVGVTISPTSAVVTVNSQQQFVDVVTGSTNTAVTWSISGPGCSGAACGSVSASGLYTAPSTVPSQGTVIVTVTSKASTSSSASASVTVAPTNNSKFSGQYAFSFTGFDSAGVYQAAGSFTADGNGNLVSGLEDVNSSTGLSTSVAFSGTYQMGSDSRGVMTINNSLGAQTFKFALNLQSTKGRLISFDQSGIRGSGVIELQDPTAFNAGALAGGYVFNLTGMDFLGMRIGALGLIFTDGTSFISGSSLDVNDGGSISPTYATFSGSYAVDSTGRGTATLNIPGFDGGVFDFAFYVVSANEFLMISVDPLGFENPIFSGPAELQTGTPFTSASFNGGSVFSFNGTNGNAPDDTVGRFLFDGKSKVGVTYDENNGGTVTVGGQWTGAYDVELNGRGTMNLASTSGGSTIWYLYAISPNTAFIMDGSTGAVSVGEMKAQVAVSPFANPDILGTYLIGSGEPIVLSTPLESGDASFDGGSSIQGLGSGTGKVDISQPSALTPNLSFTGTYSVSSVSNNGRGVILLTSPASNTIAVWVTSDSEFVGLDVDAVTPQPTILHFEQ